VKLKIIVLLLLWAQKILSDKQPALFFFAPALKLFQ
jgi:hypothetical protein